MTFLINIVLFLIIFFLYIHITQQLKTSEDLEIYEMDYTTNSQLQEVCDLKQPVLFNYKTINPDLFENITYEKLDDFELHDVKLKDINDYLTTNQNQTSVDYLNIPYKTAKTFMVSDTKSAYFIENNGDFIEETGIYSDLKENDNHLKPSMNLLSKYDICSGSPSATTHLRYHCEYRRFICVHSGKCQIKMTPFKSTKYLHGIKDYENYEFYSPVNPWKPQKEYRRDIEKIKFLEFDINPGYILYIPPYWWYSIKFSNQTTNLFTSYEYISVMNCIANLPHWVLYFIQQHNIKNKITKTLEMTAPESSEEKKEKNDDKHEKITENI
jgi:hypothetical protein